MVCASENESQTFYLLLLKYLWCSRMKRYLVVCACVPLVLCCTRSASGGNSQEAASYLSAIIQQFKAIERFDVIMRGESIVIGGEESVSTGVGSTNKVIRWKHDPVNGRDETFSSNEIDYESEAAEVSRKQFIASIATQEGVLQRMFPKRSYLLTDSKGPEQFLRYSDGFAWETAAILPFPPSYVPSQVFKKMAADCTIPSETLGCFVDSEVAKIVLKREIKPGLVGTSTWVVDRDTMLPRQMIFQNFQEGDAGESENEQGLRCRQTFEWGYCGDTPVPVKIEGQRWRTDARLEKDVEFNIDYSWELKWIRFGEDLDPNERSEKAILEDFKTIEKSLDWDNIKSIHANDIGE